MNDCIVSLRNISVKFDGELVLDNLDLDISKGKFVTLLGPSGCGKTTILRTIGGFLHPDKGDVYFENKKITNYPPNKREVNTVFQKYALFPHLNVFDNGTVVTPDLLIDAKIIKDIKSGVKILGCGTLEKKLTIKAHKFSASASEEIKRAGGTAEVI